MVSNLTIDALGGLVPVVGDLFDAIFKCNTMNVDLLEIQLYRYYDPETVAELSKSSKKVKDWRNNGVMVNNEPPRTTSGGVLVNEEPTRTANISYLDYHENNELRKPPAYAAQKDIEKVVPLGELKSPEPAQLHQQNGQSDGWFSRLRNRLEEPDLELGERAPDQPAQSGERPDGMF